LTLSNNTFLSIQNSISVSDCSTIRVLDNLFSREDPLIIVDDLSYAGALDMHNVKDVSIQGSNVFKNLIGLEGGAIKVAVDLVYKRLN